MSQGTGQFIYELERVYTVLACLTVALLGWSSLRSRAVPVAVAWFAIGWAVLDGFLYLPRIFRAPLGPNLAMLAIGAALLVRRGGWPTTRRLPPKGSQSDVNAGEG